MSRSNPLIPRLGSLPRELWLSEAEEVSWHEFLKGFIEDAYPKLFAPHGITLGDALIIWGLNDIRAELPFPPSGNAD